MSKSVLASPTGPPVRARLIRARYQQGWSQQDMADQLGTTPLNISRWERGLTQPNRYFRYRLRLLFGIGESELDHLLALQERVLGAARTFDQDSEVRSFVHRDICIARSSSSSQPALGAFDGGSDLNSTLPFPLVSPPLLGRGEELSVLKRQLLRSRGGIVALSGLPGVGKTALAVTLAHDARVRERFAGGVLWASLGPTPQFQMHFRNWSRLLGISEREYDRLGDVREWVRLLGGYLGPLRCLIVLDDVWCYEDVLACLAGGPRCSYLLTTRSPLLARQVSLQSALYLRELDDEASMQMLEAWVPEVAQLCPQGVQALLRQMAGLPLALSLIGQHLRLHAATGQPRRLLTALNEMQQASRRLEVDRYPFPQEGIPSCATTTISLEGALRVSVQRLGLPARIALGSLATLTARPGSFTEQVALACCQQSVEVLDELSDAGLLESEGEGRYSLHPCVADYARVYLADRPGCK